MGGDAWRSGLLRSSCPVAVQHSYHQHDGYNSNSSCQEAEDVCGTYYFHDETQQEGRKHADWDCTDKPRYAGAAASVFKYSYSAVEFPLWKVAIGASDNAVFTVPNGYCYANACLDDFAKVGTQSTFKGTEKLGELVKGPNMAVVDATTACGRANVACAAAPATWNGGPAVMNKVGCTATTCTAAGILNTTGAIPVV